MRSSILTKSACALTAVTMLALAAAGCETARDNPRTTGALVGAGTGALAGSAIAPKGNKTEGAAIGAAAGAGGGWLIGDQVDKSNDDHDRRDRRD
jgi:uncharacterized protein YcfJ